MRQSNIWYTVHALMLVNRIIVIDYFVVAKAGKKKFLVCVALLQMHKLLLCVIYLFAL